MEMFIMQLFNGISVSSILLLAAVGLAITFGLMGVINMAHGEFIMIGAYTTYQIQKIFKTSMPKEMFDHYFLVSLIVSFFIAAVLGLVLERLVIRHLYGRAADSLLVTWGVSLVLQQLVKTIFGATPVSVEAPGYLSSAVSVTDFIVLPYTRIIILVLAVLSIVGVWFLMNRTRHGRNIRACMQNRNMAASLGVNTGKIDATTFAIGSGLAGIAGCALTLLGSITPYLGTNYIVDAFMTVVVGGAGSLIGTVIGSLFIGVGGSAFEFLTNPSIGKVLIFVCLILILQFKPKGIVAIHSRALDE